MWSDACELLARAERMQQQFFQLKAMQAASWEPPVDLLETDQALWVIVALPGVEPADVRASIDAGVLSVLAVRRLPAMVQSAEVHRLEIPYGRFERRVRLPAGSYEVSHTEILNGCLVLRLGKLA
jgi:HSP20 family molecular chaperone IbpA